MAVLLLSNVVENLPTDLIEEGDARATIDVAEQSTLTFSVPPLKGDETHANITAILVAVRRVLCMGTSSCVVELVIDNFPSPAQPPASTPPRLDRD